LHYKYLLNSISDVVGSRIILLICCHRCQLESTVPGSCRPHSPYRVVPVLFGTQQRRLYYVQEQ
jgi:hypothetical protein